MKKKWKTLNDVITIHLPDGYDACSKDEIFKISKRPCNWGVLVTTRDGFRECGCLTIGLHRMMKKKPCVWVKGFFSEETRTLIVTNPHIGWQPW